MKKIFAILFGYLSLCLVLAFGDIIFIKKKSGGTPETITFTLLDTVVSYGSATANIDGSTSTSGDDLFLFIAIVESNSLSSISDGGFSLVTSQDNPTGSVSPDVYLYHKVATGSESSTITITVGSASPINAQLIEVGGTDTTTRTTSSDEVDANDFTLTGVTVPTDGAAIQFAACYDDPWASYPAGNYPPSGTTNLSRFDNSDTGVYGTYITYVYSDGATGNIFYDTNGYRRWAGIHLTVEAGTL